MSEHFFGSNKGFEILAILGENPLVEIGVLWILMVR